MNTNEYATIKEISDFMFVSEETIGEWIENASEKYPTLKNKNDYSFDEVIIILCAGGHTIVAMLLKLEAEQIKEQPINIKKAFQNLRETIFENRGSSFVSVKKANTKIPVNVSYQNGIEWINARELHTVLNVGRDFSNWIKSRIEEYNFQEESDYQVFFAKSGEKSKRGRPLIEYSITIDMAKELSMLENNDIGRQVRRYFIEVENKTRSLTAKIQEIGNIDSILSHIIINKIYQLFAKRSTVDMRALHHLIELSSAKSAFTGKYIMAKDVALALINSECRQHNTMSKSYIETKVTEIRAILDKYGITHMMDRRKNGDYIPLPEQS